MDNPEADAIRSRMAALRTRASGRAYRLTRETKQFLDWKHYVRLAPWLVVGGAAALGYFLIPSKRRAPPTRIEYIHGEPIRPGVVAAPVVEKRPPRESFVGSMFTFARNALWRAASVYAGQQLGNLLAGPNGAPDSSAENFDEYSDRNYI